MFVSRLGLDLMLFFLERVWWSFVGGGESFWDFSGVLVGCAGEFI